MTSMKAPKSVDDLASRLSTAATAPLQVLKPADSGDSREEPKKAAAPSRARVVKPKPETLGINLRPTRALYERYVALAADRSRTAGRMVSAQQIMLEVLERART